MIGHVVKTILAIVLCVFSFSLHAENAIRTFDNMIEKGEVRMGVSLFAPWTMRGKDGRLIGSEVDIAHRLAADMGVTAKLSVYEWDQLINALRMGEIDIVVAGMAVTPSRALAVNFSQPYAFSGVDLVANSERTKQFKSVKDVQKKSVSIGVVSGTISEKVAKRRFEKSTIRIFPTQAKVEEALLKGELHAYVGSSPGPKFLAIRHPEKVDLPLSKPLHISREAFAVRKGDYDFVNFLNAWIVARSADGWLMTTRNYWFERLQWRELEK